MMKLALSLASVGVASAFVETPRRGAGRSPALGASKPRPDDGRVVTTIIPDVRDVVSGKYVGGVWKPTGDRPGGDDFLDTRVPPPAGFANKTPMPMDDGPTANPRTSAPRTSQALPFMTSPAALDGTLAGDVGFDPLGFASGYSPFGYNDGHDTLGKYREAEVKHGRLAMLAAAGWPLAELWDTKIARFLDLEPALNDDGRVPSVLNGGIGTISTTYWVGCLALAAALDVYGSYFATKKSGYVAGDLGFDPLGFYPRGASPKDAKGRDRLRLSEIKHGRLAMLAITAFAAQEFVTHIPVVDQTPVFFRPLWDVLSEQVPGYYIPPEALGEAASVVAPELAVPAAVEAAAVVPEVAAATEAVAAVPEVAFPAVAEAVTVVPPTAAVESLSAAPAAAVAAPTDVASAAAEELTAAKARIVDLEAKLAQIDALTR